MLQTTFHRHQEGRIVIDDMHARLHRQTAPKWKDVRKNWQLQPWRGVRLP
jgi:hypothetical protein